MRIVNKTLSQIYSSTYPEVIMFDGAFRPAMFVTWLFFIAFVSGAPKPGSEPKPGSKPGKSIKNCESMSP